MDVSVRHLNNRLTLQLPAELPLGLVFVAGEVKDLSQLPDGRFQFMLSQAEYQLRCVLTERTSQEIALAEPYKVRAGGHLIFDVRLAGYYLLARDVEIIGQAASALPSKLPPERNVLPAILAEISRRSRVVTHTGSELPVWVKRMAPPDIQAELVELETEDQIEGRQSEPERIADDSFELSEEFVAYLSDAMDGEEVVELNSELLAKWRGRSNATRTGEEARPVDLKAQPIVSLSRSSSRKPDRLMTFFIATLLIVSVIVLATLIVLLAS